MKRMIRRLTVLFTLCSTGLLTYGQDIHFSQFNSSPLNLNPALAGVSPASYRAVANYKAQWVKLAPYSTVAASFDMTLFKKSPKSNFGGIGLSIFNDRAGDGNLSTTQVNLNLAYTVLLNAKGSQSLSTGLYGGLGYRSIDKSKLTFDDQYIQSTGGTQDLSQDPFVTGVDNDKVLYGDMGAGVLWNYSRSEKANYYAGASVWHLNQPNLSFIDTRGEKLYIKFIVHGGAYLGLNKQIFILPSFLYMNQGPHNQFNIGALVKIRKSIIPSEKTSFYIGGWYRLKDAVIASARIDIGRVNIGFSYDINISGLTPASNANGGPEVSLVYTGFFPNKKTMVKYCPTL